MPELSHVDPRSSALLVKAYQVDTLTRFMTAAQSADAIACVPDLIAMARDAGMMVLHVVVAFRPGHPEVSPRNPLFSALKDLGEASLLPHQSLRGRKIGRSPSARGKVIRRSCIRASAFWIEAAEREPRGGQSLSEGNFLQKIRKQIKLAP
jgi:hypothetical protein